MQSFKYRSVYMRRFSGANEEDRTHGASGSSDSTAGVTMEALRKYLAQKLGFYDDDDEEVPERVKVSYFITFDIQ